MKYIKRNGDILEIKWDNLLINGEDLQDFIIDFLDTNNLEYQLKDGGIKMKYQIKLL